MSGAGLLVLACAALLWWSCGGRTSATAGHAHGGTRQRIMRHEAGHVVAADAVGGRVLSAQADSYGGLVKWDMTARPLADEVRASVTFLRAGELAAGTRNGCSGDRRAVNHQLRRLPRAERASALSDSERAARRIVAARRRDIDRVATQLDQKGRL